MRPPLFFALIAALLTAPLALAQQPSPPPPPPDLQPLPEMPPPPPPALDDNVPEPEVTIIRRGEDTIEEYRVNGQLYMMKVTPSHGVPYYLIDQTGSGTWQRQSGAADNLKVPMWVIFRF